MFHAFADPVSSWYSQVSYGRLQITVTPFQQWLRMPLPSTSYNVERVGAPETYAPYLQQAIAAADPLVDFHGYDIVYVVASPGSTIGEGDALPADSLQPLATPDGVPIREAAGEPAWLLSIANPNFTFAHETGHMLGLPDLYDYSAPTYASTFDFVGRWDLMSYDDAQEGMFGWQRWQLGWLDPSQIRCVQPGKPITATLAPLESPGGVKMIFVPNGTTGTATVIENRQATGVDTGICYPGALIYRLNSTNFAQGEIRVVPARDDTGVDESRCGPLARATLPPGGSFTDPSTGLTITVTSNRADGSLQVTAAQPA